MSLAFFYEINEEIFYLFALSEQIFRIFAKNCENTKLMVIWKKNYKYVKKPKKAEIIDTLKLQAENPQRMEKAMSTAKEYEYEFDSIRLAKVWDDWFVFGLDMDEGEKHQGIMVNSKLDVRLVWIYTSRNLYYTDAEIAIWRGEVLTELLRIEKESPNVDIKQVALEMVGLTDKHCVNMMTDANVYVDIIEDAREYANIVTM